jgi:Family of unknown function (DUF5309)
MAVAVNTVQTFAMIGIREQLSDVISNIDPTDTPEYSMYKKGTAKNRTPEWQIDTRRAPDPQNKVIEGNTTTNKPTVQPVRVSNVVQLFDGTIEVSTTAQAVETAGRSNELNYLLAKEGVAIKQDIEARIGGNYGSVNGNAGTPGETAGWEAWLTTNVDRGAGGANGGYNPVTKLITPAVDGTQRPLTEALVKKVVKQMWVNGAKAEYILVGASNKQTMSGLAGIATNFNDVKGNDKVTIVGSADIYVSDYGKHKIMASRTMRDRSAKLLDPSKWSLRFLQPFKTIPLAKNGHSDRRMISCELTLACENEKGNGIIADLTVS